MYAVSPDKLVYRTAMWANTQATKLIAEVQIAMNAKWKENMISEKEKHATLKRFFKSEEVTGMRYSVY
jgi:hypothetical protein